MHFVIRFEPPEIINVNYNFHSRIRPVMPDAELKEGDTVIFRGEEPLTRSEFYEIANRLAPKGIDIIFETLGLTFNNPDNLPYIFSRYRVKEILIKIFSLNFPVNDKFFSYIGTSMKTLLGLDNLLNTGFQNVSILTYINQDKFLNRIKSVYDYKNEKKLKNLYIELDRGLPIERRTAILKDLLEKFGEAEDIIVRNNDFDIRLNDINAGKTEIKSDPESGTLNLVLRNFCTNNCTFCTTRIVQRAYNAPLPFDSKERVIKDIGPHIKKLKRKNLFEIVAVEPLEHPHILEILSEINEYGFRNIRLLTHARGLKDKDLLERLKGLNVREIIIPVTFYSPESAAKNVGDPEAFNDLKSALKNISGEKHISFTFNIIISKQNYEDIEKIAQFLRSHNITNFNINLALPSIEDKRYYLPYAVSFTDLMKSVKKIKDTELKNKTVLSLAYIIPPCVIAGYFEEDIIKKIKAEHSKITKKSLSSKRDFSRHKSTVPCKKAEQCRYRDFCAGVNNVYTETFGDNEFRPLI